MMTIGDVLADKARRLGERQPRRFYFVPTPVKCDMCGDPLRADVGTAMYDARTRGGPWGCLCRSCFDSYGVGLGTGLGQRYEREADGRFWYREGGMEEEPE